MKKIEKIEDPYGASKSEDTAHWVIMNMQNNIADCLNDMSQRLERVEKVAEAPGIKSTAHDHLHSPVFGLGSGNYGSDMPPFDRINDAMKKVCVEIILENTSLKAEDKVLKDALALGGDALSETVCFDIRTAVFCDYPPPCRDNEKPCTECWVAYLTEKAKESDNDAIG